MGRKAHIIFPPSIPSLVTNRPRVTFTVIPPWLSRKFNFFFRVALQIALYIWQQYPTGSSFLICSSLSLDPLDLGHAIKELGCYCIGLSHYPIWESCPATLLLIESRLLSIHSNNILSRMSWVGHCNKSFLSLIHISLIRSTSKHLKSRMLSLRIIMLKRWENHTWNVIISSSHKVI